MRAWLFVIIKCCITHIPKHKIWQRGSINSILGQCGGCRIPATLRDPDTRKAYTASYKEPVPCILDPDVGVEYVYANNRRLFLVHEEIMEKGRIVEEARRAVRNSEDNIAR